MGAFQIVAGVSRQGLKFGSKCLALSFACRPVCIPNGMQV